MRGGFWSADRKDAFNPENNSGLNNAPIKKNKMEKGPDENPPLLKIQYPMKNRV